MPISGPAKPVFNFHEETTKMYGCTSKGANSGLISSSGRSPGRAIVLPPGVGVCKKFNVKVLYVMSKALSGELSCPCDRSCLSQKASMSV